MAEPLLITHADIAAEWHPTKNQELTPDDVTAGSTNQIWWQCPKGPDHEWQASVIKRTKRGQGCPYCAGRKVSVTNSLASLFPDIAAQWHPIKNGNVTPDQIVAGSNGRFWWQCPQSHDHQWQAQVRDRTREDGATGCPYCAGKKVSITNSLASLFPVSLHNGIRRRTVALRQTKWWPGRI